MPDPNRTIVTAARRILAVAATGVAVAVAATVTGCGSVTGHHRAKHGVAATKPCLGETGLTQSPSGRVSGCMLVGELSSGRYTVELQDTLEFGNLLAIFRRKAQVVVRDGGLKAVPPSLRRELREAHVPQPPVSIRLSPSSGPPGTRVRVVGTLPAPTTHRSLSPQLCWDGCRGGLELSGAGGVSWISRRTFVAHITVPDAPWIEGRVNRVIPLTSGSYPVDVKCVTGDASCSLASQPEGSAEFRLEDPHPPAWCRTPNACATLRVSPQAAPAGALVRVSGYAPLVEWDHPVDAQFGGNAAVVAGHPSGNEVTLMPNGTQVSMRFGRAALRVIGGRNLASLGRIEPQDEISDGQTPIAADPTNRRIVAWCAGSSIALLVDGARVAVPTAAAAAPLHAEGTYQPGDGIYRCVDVLPLSRLNVLAAFPGETGAETGIFANYAVGDSGRRPYLDRAAGAARFDPGWVRRLQIVRARGSGRLRAPSQESQRAAARCHKPGRRDQPRRRKQLDADAPRLLDRWAVRHSRAVPSRRLRDGHLHPVRGALDRRRP